WPVTESVTLNSACAPPTNGYDPVAPRLSVLNSRAWGISIVMAEAWRSRGEVGHGHLELHDVRAVLVDDLELLGQLLVEGGVEKVHEPLLVLGRDLRVLVAPERHRLDHDLAVLAPLRSRVDVA